MAGEKEDEVVLSPDDEFAAAFGQAVAAADSDEGDPPKKDEPAEDPAKEDPPKEDPPKEDPAKEDPPKEDPPKDEPKAGDQFAELTEAIKKLVPANTQPPVDKQPDEKKPDPIPEPELYEPSEEEKKILESYAKDWDEHDRAWKVREKKLTHDLTAQLSHKFTLALGNVLQQIEQGLAPLYKGHVESASERHFSAIRKEHPDFDTVQNDLSAWIQTQPKYLQPHLQKTYDEGDTADVIELVTNFKNATGRAQPQTPGAQPGSSKATPQRDVVPAHKAAELAPVESKRTPVQPASSGSVDKDDYDAGWEEAQKSAR